MIGKGKSISHTKASSSYGWNMEKNADVILKQNIVGNSLTEITNEFKLIQNQNEKCKRNTLSFVLSPTIQDGEKLAPKQLRKITKDFIIDFKLQEHQAVAFVHNDKEHKHVHLYVNRINFKGQAYKDNYIGKRSQKAAERVALLNDLVTVKDIKIKKQNKNKIIRKEIFEAHKNILKNKVNDFEEYLLKMNERRITVIPVINKESKLQGFRYHYKNENLKASEIHRSMSFNRFLIDLKLNNALFNLKNFKFKNKEANLSHHTKDFIAKNINNYYDKNRSVDGTTNRRIK